MKFGLKSNSFNLSSTGLKAVIGVLAFFLSVSVLIHFTTSSNRVTSIHHYDMTGNLGVGEAYDIHMADGDEVHLTNYTDRHPLCQDNQSSSSVDCSEYGETETSPGFEGAKNTYKNRLGLSYGEFENNRFGPFATCYSEETRRFYTCVPSPVNIGTIATKSLLK